MASRWGNNLNSNRLYFSGPQKSLEMVTEAMNLRHLLLGRKSMINLDSILKRHYFDNKDRSTQTMVFPVVMYGCESWTIKKAEHQRIDVLNCGVGEDS